jgi:hypothetical protein
LKRRLRNFQNQLVEGILCHDSLSHLEDIFRPFLLSLPVKRKGAILKFDAPKILIEAEVYRSV